MSLPELRTVSAKGLSLAWREAGAGTALVLLHGIGSSSESWEAQLGHFARDFRVIAWDAPGYGGSGDLAAEAPAAEDYAVALGGLLDAIGVERCHLVGHSLGALIAAAFAREYPDRTLSLTLANAASGHARLDRATRESKLRERLDDLAAHGPAEMAARRAPRLCAPDARAETIAKVQAVMAKVRPDGYARAARMLAQGDIVADAAAIERPALVLCGSLDRITPEDGNRAIAKALRNGRYRSLTGLGHASYVEAPDAFNQALGRFLAEQAREAA